MEGCQSAVASTLLKTLGSENWERGWGGTGQGGSRGGLRSISLNLVGEEGFLFLGQALREGRVKAKKTREKTAGS